MPRLFDSLSSNRGITEALRDDTSTNEVLNNKPLLQFKL